MIFHTQCLRSWLLLCVVAFPSAYIYFLKPFIRVKGSRLLSENTATVIVYGVLVLIALITGMEGIFSWSVAGIGEGGYGWIISASAVVMAFVCLVAEYLEAAIPFRIRNRRFPSVRPAAIYSEPSVRPVSILSIVLAAAAEELVFRQIIIGGICTELGWGLLAGVIVSSTLYGMNHVYFGPFSVIQKCSSGLVYSMLFVAGGQRILLPILCHILQNIILYCWSVRVTAQRRTAVTSAGGKELQNE